MVRIGKSEYAPDPAHHQDGSEERDAKYAHHELPIIVAGGLSCDQPRGLVLVVDGVDYPKITPDPRVLYLLQPPDELPGEWLRLNLHLAHQ